MKKEEERPRIVIRTAASSASRKSLRWWATSDQSFARDGVDSSLSSGVGRRSTRIPVQCFSKVSCGSFLRPWAGSPIVHVPTCPLEYHDEVTPAVFGPVCDGRETDLEEAFARGTDTACLETDLFGRLDQSGQVRALAVGTGPLPQKGNRLPLAVVCRNHRQTGWPTIVGVMLVDDRVTHGWEREHLPGPSLSY